MKSKSVKKRGKVKKNFDKKRNIIFVIFAGIVVSFLVYIMSRYVFEKDVRFFFVSLFVSSIVVSGYLLVRAMIVQQNIFNRDSWGIFWAGGIFLVSYGVVWTYLKYASFSHVLFLILMFLALIGVVFSLFRLMINWLDNKKNKVWLSLLSFSINISVAFLQFYLFSLIVFSMAMSYAG
jgi:O-antigen/teichoic acid export membrane protein